MIKLVILFAIIGVTYSSTDDEEKSLDKLVLSLELFGSNITLPDDDAKIADHCKSMKNPAVNGAQMLQCLKNGLQLANKSNMTTKNVFTTSFKNAGSLAHKLNAFCRLPKDKQITYAKLVNGKLAEAKKVKDRYLGYMAETLTKPPINFPEVLCLSHEYFNQLIAVHKDQNGFGDFVRDISALLLNLLDNGAKVVDVKPSEKCQFKNSYPSSKYQSFTVSYIRVLNMIK